MELFISLKQYNEYQSLINERVKLVQEKRDPTVVHKWMPIAFVDTSLSFWFKDGKPFHVQYQDHSLGSFALKKNLDTDKSFKIDISTLVNAKILNVIQSRSLVLLQRNTTDDGFCSGMTIKLYDDKNVMLEDFTLFDE